MKLKPGHRLWKQNEIVTSVFDDKENPTYRYLLECTWDDSLESVTFIMLNPSVANDEICDPTLNRCVNFSIAWGYGGIKIVNLFALISTDPQKLKLHHDPVGIENNNYILKAIKNSSQIILGWGEKYGSINNRDQIIKTLLVDFAPDCIKKTKNELHPRHPLFLKGDLKPIPF